MKVSEVLEKAKSLIVDPRNWTQGALARYTPNSLACSVSEPNAKCFCSAGAVRRAGNILGSTKDSGLLPEVQDAFELLGGVAGVPIVLFNDSLRTTHADVMGVFDSAIEQAKSLEGR